MSSGIEGDIVVAAAVAVPAVAAAAAFGAGWLAWQGGKLLVEGVVAVAEKAEEKRRQAEAEQQRRAAAAASGREQLNDMCRQLIRSMESEVRAGSASPGTDTMIAELRSILNSPAPGDVTQLENSNLSDQMRVSAVLNRRERQNAVGDTRKMKAEMEELSGRMKNLRVSFEAAVITASRGTNVKAPDPDSLERVELNGELSRMTGRVLEALTEINRISEQCGLSKGRAAWFMSCFNGVDEQIRSLYMPSASNREVRAGIRRLSDIMDNYDMLYPALAEEANRIVALYPVYRQASEALGEAVEDIHAFENASQLEKRMEELKERKARADKCAELYRRLGPSAYICYAWDRELAAMGYQVYDRSSILDMADGEKKPRYGTVDGKKLPFYAWGEDSYTQFYSLTPSCSAQLVVHNDGTISMQTIGGDGSDAESVKKTQHHHCSQLKQLHEKLRQNWFIQMGYEETSDAEAVMTVSDWRREDGSIWQDDAVRTPERTGEEKAAARAMYSK